MCRFLVAAAVLAAASTVSAGDPPEGAALPAGAILRLGGGGLNHGSPITALAWSAGRIAAADQAGTVRLWDPVTRQETFRLVWTGETLSATLAFSADGKRLLAAGGGSVRVVEPMAAGARVIALPGSPRGAAISPDGARVAVRGAEGRFRVVEIDPQRETAVGPKVAEPVSSAWSPDGRWVATAGADKVVRVWSPADGRESFAVRPPEAVGRDPNHPAPQVRFLPDGLLLVSPDERGGSTVLDPAGGRVVRRLPGVYSAVSPDGNTLIRLHHSDVCPIRFCGAADGRERLKIPDGGWYADTAAYSPDGRILANGNWHGRIRLWNAADGREITAPADHRREVTALALSADGARILSGDEEGVVVLWDAASGRRLHRWTGLREVVSAALFSGGKVAVAADEAGSVRAWSADDGREIGRLRLPLGRTRAVAFSPDGLHAAAEGADWSVALFDRTTAREVRQLQGHRPNTGVNDIVWSPSGVLTAGGDGTVRLWDPDGGREVARHRATRDARPLCAAISPDGRRVAAGTEGGRVMLWNTGDEAPTHTPSLADDDFEWVESIAFSPDGRLLAAADTKGRLRIWDADTGGVIADRSPGAGRVPCLAFSADGRRLVTAHGDGTLLVWDAAFAPGSDPAGPRPKPAESWADLASDDAAKARRAMADLSADPAAAVGVVRAGLHAGADALGERIRRLVRDLDDDDFRVRERATEQLRAIGPAAVGQLRRFRS